jgi:hypothetical protein
VTTLSRFGASQDEWAHFASLGLVEDLLPVVSNPNATISPQSTLKTLGKTPSRYNAQHQVVGIKDWTHLRATTPQVRQWSIVGDYGICLQTRRVRALDVDVDDRDEVGRIVDLILGALGPVPMRTRAGSERVLLAFQVAGPLDKRVARLPAGAVELLGDGQQFVAAGTHLDKKGAATGRYAWAMGLPTAFPVIELEALNALWSALGGQPASQRRARRELPRPAERGPGQSVPDPVVGWLEQRGWVIPGRIDYPRLNSPPSGEPLVMIHCPWKIDHTSDSGPTETVYFPAGTGGYEQGHFQCLHAHCEGRPDADFLEAVGFSASFETDFTDVQDEPGQFIEPVAPRSPPAGGVVALPGAIAVVGANGAAGGPVLGDPCAFESVADWRSPLPGAGLKRGKKGWLAVLENVTRAIDTRGFWLRVGYDTFRGEVTCCAWADPPERGSWMRITNERPVEGRRRLGDAGFEAVGRELMRDAIEWVAHRRQYDSAQLWLGGLTWDGVRRIDDFLGVVCGAEAGAYATSVSRYLWTALAGRVLVPGCRADMVPILVGPQGVHKTRGLESLAPWPEAYATVDLSARDADLARRMRGACVLELNELRGLHTRERQAINSFITERVDKWTPKYQEFAHWMSRRGIFIGTTNDQEFLDDETGNRRWLPIAVTRFGELTEAAREQHWAEAAATFLSDGVAWSEAETLARGEHEQYQIGDLWADEILAWADRRADLDTFTLRDVALGIGLDPRDINRTSEMRLAKVLRSLGYIRTRQLIEGARTWRWRQVGH